MHNLNVKMDNCNSSYGYWKWASYQNMYLKCKLQDSKLLKQAIHVQTCGDPVGSLVSDLERYETIINVDQIPRENDLHDVVVVNVDQISIAALVVFHVRG